MANYQYIVSSLPQFSFDSESRGVETSSIVADLFELLSPQDLSTLKELWWFFDLRNLLQLRSGRKPIFSALSNLSEEDAVEINKFYCNEIGENEIEAEVLAQLPKYVRAILEDSADAEESEIGESKTPQGLNRQIWSAYYKHTLSSSNKFIKQWNSFDLDVRNISAAFAARELGVDIESVIIGSNDITRLLVRNSSVQDFGLKNEFAQIEELLSILADGDMLAKERRLDKLRWQKIDDITTFDYFSLEYILGYLVQISMLERWNLLIADEGEKVLNGMVAKLVSKDHIAPDEA